MYTLQYSTKNHQAEEIIDRLKQMSLAYKTLQSDIIQEITLNESQKSIVGFANINAYLDELGKELHQWYYCSC